MGGSVTSSHTYILRERPQSWMDCWAKLPKSRLQVTSSSSTVVVHTIIIIITALTAGSSSKEEVPWCVA